MEIFDLSIENEQINVNQSEGNPQSSSPEFKHMAPI